jgi:hypothetical protein
MNEARLKMDWDVSFVDGISLGAIVQKIRYLPHDGRYTDGYTNTRLVLDALRVVLPPEFTVLDLEFSNLWGWEVCGGFYGY